ncbi:CHAT domain-containing protein [Paenibacillus sp. FSL H7-0331]
MFNEKPPTEPYLPIIPSYSSKEQKKNEQMHGLDPAVERILPAICYCLHLPRNGFDTLDMSPNTIANGYWVPHSIVLIPSYFGLMRVSANKKDMQSPTLVIYEDSCFEIAKEFASKNGSLINCVPISSLTTELLKEHWSKITSFIQEIPQIENPLHVEPELLPEQARVALPLIFQLNQFRASKELLERLKNTEFSRDSLLEETILSRSRIETLAKLEKQSMQINTKDEFISILGKEIENCRLPLVITLSGTAGRLRPRGSSSKNELVSSEKTAVEILGIHRAAASRGLWLDGGVLSTDLFTELHQLEDHCRARKQSNRFIWDSMKRIGNLLERQIGSVGIEMILSSSHISAYSDFPIGVAILPGQEDPLCCTRPISNIPISPLTRTMQMELTRTFEHYIGRSRGFKIVIVECLSRDDHIRPYSDVAWKEIIGMLNDNKSVQVIYSEAQTRKGLKDILDQNLDADILVISAHGHYRNKNNFAGLYIGKEIWLATENDIHVPPIVILSACHVAPRGLGAVTVNDLLLRSGANVVIGTLIPVDVKKNATLTGRLFAYITDALEGKGDWGRSLDQVWHHVLASNAVHEILESNKNLMEWANKSIPGKLSRIQEFKFSRSVDKLRYGHIYSDTKKVLREMAMEDGLGEYFDEVMSSQGFFPESCFYTMTGKPENVILCEPIIEDFIKSGRTI